MLVGTADAPVALIINPQMITASRRWRSCGGRESDDLRRLLGAFERVLPLRKPSDLMQRSIAQLVLSASDGVTGKIPRLRNEAAALAITDGTENITLEHLKHVVGSDR